jgi:tetratricopeptide (TPR) repeat protein
VIASLLLALSLTLSQTDARQPGPEQAGKTAQGRPQVAAGDEERELPSAIEAMNRARVTFEYGDYPQASKLLAALVEAGRFESLTLRAEAYRLLGLSLFYQGRRGEAYSAFLEYLYLDPDGQLDPFYVPPAAVSFFEQVKKEAEAKLAPIRAQKQAELETRQKAAADEAERRRQRELEEERRRLQQLTPSVERRVVQREFWVSMMPFGIGQLQNGDKTLGITLAIAQVIAGAASGGSALLIEELRDPSGHFNNHGPGGNPYVTASRLNVIKWVGAGLFYGLWAAGAIHAAIRFKPEEQLPDRLLEQRQPLPTPPPPAGN